MNDKRDKACLHAFVAGRVQGVGFRHFVLLVASQLGLFGWVRNLDDDRVEVLAEGPRAELEELLEYLRRGPRSAFVSEVKQEWLVYSGQFTSFDVAHTYFD